MHSHSKSGSTQGSSPKKSVSLGRTDSNRSAGYDDLDSVGCFPLKTKQEHSETNAFYRAMLDAKAAAKAKAEDEAKKAAANTETPVQREASEEPGITALPEPDIPDMDPSVSKTPRKNRPGALNLVPESYEDAVPTFRSYLEAKKEKKLMKMLATDVPMTPPAVSFEESPDTLTYDSSTSITNLLKGGKESAGSRSPKKKFLGLNISVPSFMSSNLDISEVPASQLMPPPKAPTSGPSSLSRRRATEKPIKPEQEDTTSHLPSKVRELRTLYDATSPVSDSPTLGRPPATTNRSVSDGVTREWEKEARDREREAEDDKLKRSKSVRHSDPSGSPPPTPPAKNTPPKTSAAETQDFDAAKDTPTISIESPPEKPVPVRSVNNLRNNYIDLIQKAPSMYSLHGDIQHLQVSHSAGVLGYSEHAQQMGEDEDEDEDEDDNQPHVSESRWSEGQLQQWKLQQKAHQKQHARFLQGDRPAPAFYSPSIYSVAFSPKPDGNDAKNKPQPILFYYPPPRSFRGHDKQSTESIPIVKRASEEPESSSKLRTVCTAAEVTSSIKFERPEKSTLMQFREDLRADSDTNSAMSAAGSATPIPSSGNRFDSSQDSMETPQKRDNVDDDSISKANAALNASLGINMTPMANKRDSRGSGDSGNSGDTTTYYPLDVAHYPSAMPTPLFRHHNQQPHNMPMSPPLSNPSFLPTPPPGYTMLAPPSHDIVILPDGSNMLTHFDILNRHIMDVAGSLHQSQNTTREQVINNALRKHEDGLKAIGEHFGDVRSQLNAVEHNLGRTTGAMDDVVTNMSKLVETVQTELLGRVEKLVNANTDLTNKVEALTSRLAELEKKHDDAATASRIEASPPPHVQQAQPQQTVPAHMQSMHVQHPQGLYYDTNGNLYGMSQGYQYYAQAHAMSKEQMMLMNPDERARKAAEDWNAHHHQRGRHDRRGDGGHYEARGRFDGANSAGGYEQNGVGYHRHS